MKKFAFIFLGSFISLGFKYDLKNNGIEQNNPFTVIFIASDSYDYSNNYKSYPCAQPIVVYVNGKYIEPPNCIKNDNDKLENNKECKNYSKLIQPYISKGAKLYELNNGIRNNTFIVQRTGITGISGGIHCGILNVKPMHTLLTNNPNIGIGTLVPLEISDRPKLKKRKDCIDYGSAAGGMLYCTDKLMSKVDIDGDGFPELIYENEVTEGYYISIYSKKNNRWIKVYEGSWDGA